MSRQSRTFFSDISKIMFDRKHQITFPKYNTKKLNQIIAYQNKQSECELFILAKIKVWDGERNYDDYTAEHISTTNNGSNLYMRNLIHIRPELFPDSSPPLPIHRVIHFQVGTIKYIALGGGRFRRRNKHTIALCVYENDKIIVQSYLKNKHFGNITVMTYYCNNQNETVLVSACEQQKITLWNINRKECSNEYFGEYYI